MCELVVADSNETIISNLNVYFLEEYLKTTFSSETDLGLTVSMTVEILKRKTKHKLTDCLRFQVDLCLKLIC